MSRSLSITEARSRLLSLPDSLRPGEELQVYRHEQPVLKVIRTGIAHDPFLIMDGALAGLLPPRRHTVRTLASHYKAHLYGKKR